MPEYRIEIAASAAREFDHLPTVLQSRVRKAIDKLGANPRPPGTVKIRGATDLFRFRVYDREKLVDIIHIRHRREAYE